jgi:hypothetical protein
MKKLLRLVLVAGSAGVLSLASSAQIQHGGVPRSQVVPLGGAVPSVTLPGFDVEELLAEDETRTSGEAFRWALVHEVQLGLAIAVHAASGGWRESWGSNKNNTSNNVQSGDSTITSIRPVRSNHAAISEVAISTVSAARALTTRNARRITPRLRQSGSGGSA